MSTTIEWTDETWNPVTGCEKISPGCAHCYAKSLHDMRHRAVLNGRKMPAQYAEPFERVHCWPERLEIPLHWRTPRLCFVNSMSDLFHEDVPDDFVDRVFAVMALAQRHTFQILTKRPIQMARQLARLTFERLIECCNQSADGGKHRPGAYNLGSIDARSRQIRFVMGEKTAFNRLPHLPLPNVWPGVSIESKKYLYRLDLLCQIPAAVRMVSFEPLLEDLGAVNLQGIGWAIVGGESGPGARPVHPDWVRSLRDQCVAQGVPFFFKQWGEWAPAEKYSPSEAVSMIRAGKKHAGALLDGREWRQFPNSYAGHQVLRKAAA